MNDFALRQFHENKVLRESVKEFFIWNLRELAATMAFDGETTGGIKEAAILVDKSFDKLEELYGKVKSKEIPSSR